jgi:uncharacterized protein
MSDLEIRSVELRADADEGTVEGIAVPWMTPTSIGGQYNEQFERGSIPTDGDAPKLFWNHAEPIGRVIESEDRAEGHWIKARISDTAAGRDARTLMRDGVVDKFSVGFRPVSHREEDDGTITRTSVHLAEVSAVPFPAYQGAQISNVRSEVTKEVHQDLIQKEDEMADNAVTPEDLDEVRTGLENLDRRFATLSTPAVPVVADTRTSGEVLKDLIREGDKGATAETLNRAYAGATTADSVQLPQWIGDLTRLVNSPSPLRNVFSVGTLPSTGNVLEYGQLKSDTTVVGTQVNEGDNLVFGKVQVETATAPVKAFGGYSELSYQAIDRSSVNYLTTTLNAQANATARYLDANFRSEYVAEVAAQTTAGNTVVLDVTSSDYTKWLDGIIDAAGAYQDKGLTLDGLIVDKAAFKAVAHLVGSDGRPLFSLNGGGQGVNTVGSLNVTALTGQIANVTVVLDAKLTGNVAFYNAAALREYRSPIVRLQDDNIINLTRDFSIYSYVATAHEEPTGIVPVKKTA